MTIENFYVEKQIKTEKNTKKKTIYVGVSCETSTPSRFLRGQERSF